MTNNVRVFHETRRFWMKFGQVEKAIARNCSFKWVIYGETFRDATPAEAINMRNQQAKDAEPLPMAEWGGVKFVAPANAKYSEGAELKIAAEANRFFAEAMA